MTVTPASRAWHAALLVVGAVALAVQTWLVVTTHASFVDFLSYFTIQSNVLVLVASANLVAGRPWDGTAWRLVRLAGLVGITVTGVVYAIAIGPNVSFDGAAWWCDKVFHYVVPAMAVVGHLAFRPRDTFVRADLAFLAWPIAWLAYTLVRGAWGSPAFPSVVGPSRFPYDFLDLDTHGGPFVAVACVVVTALFLLVAAGYLRLGRGRST